ncbi:MAG: arsenic efflux protein [Clostridiales bacterium]|nr:arsenic efflux protein [Clostridiales bacterium]
MGEVFLDAFLDTLKVLPFLLVMNFLIEFIEYRSKGFKADKILLGGAAPALGTAVGIIPQCGFSVVATELYGKKKIALGTLLAVYIATSDEALPIMLSSPAGLGKLWPVLVIKVCFALIVGYAVFGLGKLFNRKKVAPVAAEINPTPEARASETDRDGIKDREENHGHEHEHEHNHDEHEEDGEIAHIHGCHHHSFDERGIDATATKKQKAAWVWNVFLKHPLIHTGTVIFFIFVVNVAFGLLVYYIGEDKITAFLNANKYLQPIFSALIGLIPNCAGSVVITEFYVVGGLSLGGVVSGLCVSAGIGYAVLIRENRPVKNTALVIVLMYVLSVALGLIITLIGF